MNCPACGSSVPEGQSLCPHCGLGIPNEESSASLVESGPGDAGAGSESLPAFFAVSLWKLAVMSIFTLGLYDFYWFYQNWQRVRVREQRNISPSIRVFFGVFFCYSCFRRIRSYGLAKGHRQGPPILLLAPLWVASKLSSYLPAPLMLFSLIGVVFLLPMQAYANRINAEEVPTHDRNARFIRSNWIWILIGACLLLLTLLRLVLAPSQEPS